MGISPATIARNLSIEAHLAEAAALSTKASRLFESGHRTRPTQMISAALAELTLADRAMSRLSSRSNLLSESTRRWTTHALRDAEASLSMLQRPGRISTDARSILTDLLGDTRKAASLAAESADRSLASTRLRSLPHVHVAEASTPLSTGDVVVDGQLLDALGNPVSSIRNADGPDAVISEFGTRDTGGGSFDVPAGIFLG